MSPIRNNNPDPASVGNSRLPKTEPPAPGLAGAGSHRTLRIEGYFLMAAWNARAAMAAALRPFRRLFGRVPVVYIHPVYLRPARIEQVADVLMVWYWGNAMWRLVHEAPLFDPRYGLVGSGPDCLIQTQEGQE